MNTMTALLPHIKLRFNVEHPSFEECYIYGYECALADIGEAENPFKSGSRENEQWLEGWWAGFYGEGPLFTLTAEHQDVETVKKSSKQAANDHAFYENMSNFFAKVIEISGLIAASAAVGYQVIDLVA